MTEKSKDIFGQIDALLGRRGGEALTEKNPLNDDFPVLTEVIDGEGDKYPRRLDRRSDAQSNDPSGVSERRQGQRRKPTEADSIHLLSAGDKTLLVAELERVLTDLFALEQRKLETMLRGVIREELNAGQRHLDEQIAKLFKAARNRSH